MKKIFITGARGFIGSNLTENKKYEWATVPGNIDLCGLYHENTIKQCDAVVHLAGSNRDDNQTLLRTNIQGTLQILMLAAKYKKKFIYIGSQYEHKSAYKASKDVAAYMVKSLSENLDFPAVNLFLPQVFGPKCKPYYNSFATTLLYLMAKNMPFESLVLDENATLNLVHVDEVCNTIERHLDDEQYQGLLCEEKLQGKKITIKEFIDTIRGKNCGILYDEIQSTYEWYKNNVDKMHY